MTEYMVAWYIQIEADSPEDAAKQAREMQLDPQSTATIFTVRGPDGAICVDMETGERLPSDEGPWPG